MDKERNSELILGVKKDIIVKFLELIRDRYHIVDKANYFLEKSGVSGVNIAIVNQRDALSHLCTILRNDKLEEDEQLGQYYAAEEHLRRAIIESYQIALSMKKLKILDLYDRYKLQVMPIKNKHNCFSNAPDISMLKELIREIDDLGNQGRAAKSRNTWDDEWENGVMKYTQGFLKADQLEGVLEDYISIASQKIKPIDSKTKILLSISTIAVLLNIILLINYFS